MSVIGVMVAVKSFSGFWFSGTSNTFVSTPTLVTTTRGFSHSGPIRTRCCEASGPPSGVVCADADGIDHGAPSARQSARRTREMEARRAEKCRLARRTGARRGVRLRADERRARGNRNDDGRADARADAAGRALRGRAARAEQTRVGLQYGAGDGLARGQRNRRAGADDLTRCIDRLDGVVAR